MSHVPAPPAPPLSREEVWQIAERCSDLLKTRFGARRVIVFGSAAGQAPWHCGSDLDLAVEGIRPEEFFRAHSALEELAPRNLKVDLVDLRTVYPEMRARILGEVEMPDDPLLALKSIVDDELTALERIVTETEETLAEAHTPPTRVELRALGDLAHDFFCGVESIFKRIAVRFDEGGPTTTNWHRDLLHKMNVAQTGRRPVVIDNPLWARLADYLDFRHFFRNAYRATLEWDKMQPHIAQMRETLEMLQAQLAQFFATVQAEKGKS